MKTKKWDGVGVFGEQGDEMNIEGVIVVDDTAREIGKGIHISLRLTPLAKGDSSAGMKTR